jgi:hypothetical protein
MTADPGNGEGEAELDAAVDAGFNDTGALEELLLDAGISESAKEAVRKALDRINASGAPGNDGAAGAPESEGNAQAGAQGGQE